MKDEWKEKRSFIKKSWEISTKILLIAKMHNLIQLTWDCKSMNLNNLYTKW